MPLRHLCVPQAVYGAVSSRRGSADGLAVGPPWASILRSEESVVSMAREPQMKIRRLQNRQVAVTLVFFALSGILHCTAQTRAFGRTVAEITVGRDTLDSVRALYGPGAQTNVQNVRTLCYYVESDQTYLTVSTFQSQNRVSTVSITTFTAVMPGCRDAKVTGKHVTGPAGVRLGESMQAVFDALGKPSDTGKIKIGIHQMAYSNYAIAGGLGTCQFEGDKLVLLAIQLSPEEDKALANSNAALIATAQEAAVAAVNFSEGDATAFNHSRSEFTPDGWRDFVKAMTSFLDQKGAPKFTSSFVAAHSVRLISEKDSVLRLRIPGTLTQSNKLGKTTYRAALEVDVLRTGDVGGTSFKIQRLEPITYADASPTCR